MASLYASTPSALPKSCPFLTKVDKKRIYFRVFACQANKDEQQIKAPRRNVLIGLGGLCGAAASFANDPFASAAPIPGPNVYNCRPATYKLNGAVIPGSCCPPVPALIIDFRLPAARPWWDLSPVPPLNVRPAAHLVDKSYVKKYEEAIRLMKALPDDDPRSFKQQANLHCAYCNGAYYQDRVFPSKKLSVHMSWIFLPFHRFYLYFFEKICQELLNDPTFAIPFWNWDNPLGMTMPEMFAANCKSPLYDKLRNSAHYPPVLVDLNGDCTDRHRPREEQVRLNLASVKKNVQDTSDPLLFCGGKYRAGDGEPGATGSLENIHNLIHRWTGDKNQPYEEDLGNFYSAGRDPIFYAHHGNVDRLWSVWRSFGQDDVCPWTFSDQYQDFHDYDFLNASFLFYNEKKQMVRVYVRDSLYTSNLGYVYQDVDNPWVDYVSKPQFSKDTRKQLRTVGVAPIFSEDIIISPVKLDKVVKVLVKRPDKMKRSTKGETLVIEKIWLEGDKFVKFDVFINDEDEPKSTPENSEFAGFFSSLPHGGPNHDHGGVDGKMSHFARLLLPLTRILKEMEAEDDDDVTVTLVPRAGCDDVTVGGIKIVTGLNSLDH